MIFRLWQILKIWKILNVVKIWFDNDQSFFNQVSGKTLLGSSFEFVNLIFPNCNLYFSKMFLYTYLIFHLIICFKILNVFVNYLNISFDNLSYFQNTRYKYLNILFDNNQSSRSSLFNQVSGKTLLGSSFEFVNLIFPNCNVDFSKYKMYLSNI